MGAPEETVALSATLGAMDITMEPTLGAKEDRSGDEEGSDRSSKGTKVSAESKLGSIDVIIGSSEKSLDGEFDVAVLKLGAKEEESTKPTEGENDFVFVAIKIGTREGDPVGVAVGSSEGEVVTRRVGCCPVGVAVGKLVGLVVGLSVGADVGFVVGDEDSLGVGLARASRMHWRLFSQSCDPMLMSQMSSMADRASCSKLFPSTT